MIRMIAFTIILSAAAASTLTAQTVAGRQVRVAVNAPIFLDASSNAREPLVTAKEGSVLRLLDTSVPDWFQVEFQDPRFGRRIGYIERRFVVESLCPGLHQRDFGSSLYGLWTGRFGLEIAGADQTIRASAIRGREARLMGVPGGAAGLVVRSVGWLRDGKPLWWERTLYRGDAYAFRNRLGPIQTARPAAGSFITAEEEDFS